MDLFDGMPSDQFPQMNEVTGAARMDFMWVWNNRNPEQHWGAAFYRGNVFLFQRYEYLQWMHHGGIPIGVEVIYKPKGWW
jgi:hypothetical protein